MSSSSNKANATTNATDRMPPPSTQALSSASNQQQNSTQNTSAHNPSSSNGKQISLTPQWAQVATNQSNKILPSPSNSSKPSSSNQKSNAPPSSSSAAANSSSEGKSLAQQELAYHSDNRRSASNPSSDTTTTVTSSSFKNASKYPQPANQTSTTSVFHNPEPSSERSRNHREFGNAPQLTPFPLSTPASSTITNSSLVDNKADISSQDQNVQSGDASKSNNSSIPTRANYIRYSREELVALKSQTNPPKITATDVPEGILSLQPLPLATAKDDSQLTINAPPHHNYHHQGTGQRQYYNRNDGIGHIATPDKKMQKNSEENQMLDTSTNRGLRSAPPRQGVGSDNPDWRKRTAIPEDQIQGSPPGSSRFGVGGKYGGMSHDIFNYTNANMGFTGDILPPTGEMGFKSIVEAAAKFDKEIRQNQEEIIKQVQIVDSPSNIPENLKGLLSESGNELLDAPLEEDTEVPPEEYVVPEAECVDYQPDDNLLNSPTGLANEIQPGHYDSKLMQSAQLNQRPNNEASKSLAMPKFGIRDQGELYSLQSLPQTEMIMPGPYNSNILSALHQNQPGPNPNFMGMQSHQQQQQQQQQPPVQPKMMPNPSPVLPDWFYLDPQMNVQGPFSSSDMRDWLSGGYFTPNLPIRASNQFTFQPLSIVFPNIETAFLYAPPTQPMNKPMMVQPSRIPVQEQDLPGMDNSRFQQQQEYLRQQEYMRKVEEMKRLEEIRKLEEIRQNELKLAEARAAEARAAEMRLAEARAAEARAAEIKAAEVRAAEARAAEIRAAELKAAEEARIAEARAAEARAAEMKAAEARAAQERQEQQRIHLEQQQQAAAAAAQTQKQAPATPAIASKPAWNSSQGEGAIQSKSLAEIQAEEEAAKKTSTSETGAAAKVLKSSASDENAKKEKGDASSKKKAQPIPLVAVPHGQEQAKLQAPAAWGTKAATSNKDSNADKARQPTLSLKEIQEQEELAKHQQKSAGKMPTLAERLAVSNIPAPQSSMAQIAKPATAPAASTQPIQSAKTAIAAPVTTTSTTASQKTAPASIAKAPTPPPAAASTVGSSQSTVKRSEPKSTSGMSTDMRKWCEMELKNLKSASDASEILFLMDYCYSLQDNEEIRETLLANLGSAQGAEKFVSEFLRQKDVDVDFQKVGIVDKKGTSTKKRR